MLFLGGARSGKSTLVERIAAHHTSVAYVATAEAIDDEMCARIQMHRAGRPEHWATFEVKEGLLETLNHVYAGDAQAIIIDCMTVYIGRRMQHVADDREILNEIDGVLRDMRACGRSVLIVSNEVGMGGVPAVL